MHCPICEMTDILTRGDLFECVICGHEWQKEDSHNDDTLEERVVKDAHGNMLADGDIVAMVKDIKLGGTSDVLKIGTKSKPIRLVEGDHEISCKMNGVTIALKAMYVKKVGA